jgi:hypothetical protein
LPRARSGIDKPASSFQAARPIHPRLHRELSAGRLGADLEPLL